jgi:hypothetical protein
MHFLRAWKGVTMTPVTSMSSSPFGSLPLPARRLLIHQFMITVAHSAREARSARDARLYAVI